MGGVVTEDDEEGDDGVGLGGGFEVGELGGGLESLGWREAAGADELVLHGKASVWKNSGDEAVELRDRRCRGGRDLLGEDAAP